MILLSTPRDVLHKCLLSVCVQTLIRNHVMEPSVFEDGGEDLAHT